MILTLSKPVRDMALRRSVGTLVGVLVDRASAEPPNRYHPVAWLGQGLELLESKTYDDSRLAGTGHLALSLAASLLSAGAVRRAVRVLPGGVGVVDTAVFVAASSGGKMLGDTALRIKRLLDDGDVDGARLLLPHLVGRDASKLSPEEITRAVIESVAENTVDAATAVLTFGVFTGAAGVWLHRTINTLDAMVGHHNKRYENFGWASANLDDVANWVPARLSVFATVLASRTLAGFDVPSSEILATAFDDGKKHPSPNGGLIEAAFASALDVTLGGTNSYGGRVEQRGTLGTGRAPTPDDIARCVVLSNRVVSIMAGLPTALMLGHAYTRRAVSSRRR